MFMVLRRDEKGELLVGLRASEEDARRAIMHDALVRYAARSLALVTRLTAGQNNGTPLAQILTAKERQDVQAEALARYVIARIA
jgi:hypothetical protein